MHINLLQVLSFQSAFLLVLVAGETIYRFFRIHPEITRKFSHVTLSLIALLVPSFTRSVFDAIILASIGMVIIILGSRFDLLRSINSVGRKSAGTWTFVISLLTCYLAGVLSKDLSLFYIPIIILALADSAAALTGTFLPVKKWPETTPAGKSNKTFAGSIMFFLIAFVIVMVILPGYHPGRPVFVILTGLIISLIGALVEAFTGKGFDNLTVPGSILLILILIGNL